MGDAPPAWVNAVDTNAMDRVLEYMNNVAVLTYFTTLKSTVEIWSSKNCKKSIKQIEKETRHRQLSEGIEGVIQ